MTNRIMLGLFAIILLLSACTSPQKQTPPAGPEATTVGIGIITQTPGITDGYPVPGGVAYPEPAGGAYPEPQNQPLSSGPDLPTGTPDSSQSPLVITDVIHNQQGEYIVLKNVTAQAQNTLGFWLLNYDSNVEFYLPKLELAADETVTIYNGPETINSSEGIKWQDTPVLVDAGDKLMVLNNAGRVIWYYVYYPTQ